ncbi:alkaline phosphatase D family protein [Streptomyces bacillaris]|uniref:alkaline phosphatase D family protein n=1 Tax=Streptomyces bacillaris TaxID=68179 RepID=UPI0034616A3F
MTSRHVPSPSRRTVVRAAAATAAAVPVLATATTAPTASATTTGQDSAARTPAPAFLHGVASGDPLPDGVLLWTRVTPEPGAEPGSGRGADTPVRWEVAEDREFTAIAASGTTLAAASSDHTVKADVRGLRPARPAHEILDLADYRTRHGNYKTDADLQALHAAHPMIAIWDDHEVANDAWSGGAQNHTPGTEGEWAERVAAAKQAYFEWMPVRASTEGTVYRRLRFGRLADLHLLDLRSFRSQQASIGSGAVDDPERTITGRAQLDWLKAGLAGSDAVWKLVGTSVMISPVAFGALPAHLLQPLAGLLGLPKEGLAVNVDQWDGYTDDRRELIAHLRERGITDTVFLTGDIHMAWANEVPVRAATYPLSPSAATEFVVTSVTSDNLDDILRVAPQTVSLAAATAVRTANRHVKWVDMDSHGYGVLDVTAERAQMDYYVLSDKKAKDSAASWARSYRTRRGTQKVERADLPVR